MVAMEASGVYWKPVWNILSDGEFELIVVTAAHIKNVPGRKTDVNDATWIVDLLACGLIRGSFVPDEHFRELRALQRTPQAAGARADQGAPKAACAVATSLLTTIYQMLKEGTAYRDLGAGHFDKRATWVKVKRLVAQLAKLGYQASLQPLAEAA